MARVVDRVMRKLVPRPADIPRPWRGIDVEGAERTFRFLRYGDCGWRENNRGHSLGQRAGYPLVMAERLAESGISTSFSDVYLGPATRLPETGEELTRFVKLDGPPDIVLLECCSAHAVRSVIPLRKPWYNDLRINVGDRSGALARPVYPFVHWATRHFGRIVDPFPGTDRHARFFELVRAQWPDATLLMMSPLCRIWTDGFLDAAEQMHVWHQIDALCEEMGVQVVDTRDTIDSLRATLGVRAVNAFNGYDLRRPGHEAVADLLMPHAAERLGARVPREVTTGA